MRQTLAKQYDQSDTTEKAINDFLGFKGKTADFLGYNSKTHQWLIAESKGSHITDAVAQLGNTARNLLVKYPDANIELRIYLDARNYRQLTSRGGLYGWRMSTEGYLGFPDEMEQFTYELAQGIRILVQVAPAT